MISTENKSWKKGKDEKIEQYCGWESSAADNGSNDDNAFHGWQKTKQEEKCRYLDERNILLLPHVTVKSWFSSLEGNDVVEKLCPKCDRSQDDTSSNKSPVALQSNSDIDCLPINSMSSNSMTHKQNIIYSPSPSNLELKQSQPLVQWVPSTHEEKCEESVPWRCKGFAPVNRETKPAEPLNLCKWPAAQRLEWCHESLARLAHLGVQSPKNAFPVCRRRPVIQRPLVGHKGTQVVNGHVNKHFCWTSSSKSLLSEDGPKPATQLDPYNKAVNSSLWSAVQEGCGKKTMQQDVDHTFHRNNVSWLSNTLCPSGYHGNSASSTMLHDITLFHILQVLQSEPVNFPQVRRQRRLESLPSLNA